MYYCCTLNLQSLFISVHKSFKSFHIFRIRCNLYTFFFCKYLFFQIRSKALAFCFIFTVSSQKSDSPGSAFSCGIALLASYMMTKKDGESLAQFLDNRVFAGNAGVKIDPDGFHIMKKSEYSGMFGDYSSYSEEYEELADATLADEEESGDEE